MSRTLAVVDNDVAHLTRRVEKLEKTEAFYAKMFGWFVGAGIGIGFIFGLLAPALPKLIKALGFG